MEINQYNICDFPVLRGLTIKVILKYLQDHTLQEQHVIWTGL